MKNSFYLFTFLSICLVVSGCAAPSTNQDKYYILAHDVTQTTNQLAGCIRFDNPPTHLSDQELIAFCTRRNPRPAQALNRYAVKVVHDNKDAIVLVCSPDGANALIEDASCTEEIDRNHWKQPSPCQFTLRLLDACKK
ncbi:MAG: hypothetical protein ACOZHQ_02580 [Thermodesulfobacteriota bacterium]